MPDISPLTLPHVPDAQIPGGGGLLSHFVGMSSPVIHDYWSQVVQFLHDKMGSPMTVDPRLCLLGLFPNPEDDKFDTFFLQKQSAVNRWEANFTQMDAGTPSHSTSLAS